MYRYLNPSSIEDLISPSKINIVTYMSGFVEKKHKSWTDRFSLTACVDYWYLSPDFTITQTVAYGQHLIVPGVYELSNASSINTTSGSASYTQKMNSFNLTLGVAMKL